MIHEIRDWMFKVPLEDYVLTFDDGLYSQYYYWERFKKIPTEKIFFISSGIVHIGETRQSRKFPTCKEAHNKFFRYKATENYMRVDQIKELMKDPLVSIGGHSHSHTNIQGKGLVDQVSYIRKDTKQMMEWFDKNLGIRPTKFCFPYNFNNWVYSGLLKTDFNLKDLYGEERQDIMEYENLYN